MEFGMAVVKLDIEAERLAKWTRENKPEQRHLTFPNIFHGKPVDRRRSAPVAISAKRG